MPELIEPWEATPVADLPLIICGPILRRVEKNEVSVWMVLKNKRKVTLKIYGPDIGPGSTAALFQSEEVIPTKLGTNVFVVCVQAKTELLNLDDDSTYGYNLDFNNEEDGSIVDLDSPGVLKQGVSGLDSITYENTPIFGEGHIGASLMGMKLPTFVLPKTDLEKLRVLHGSCRKPHGEGVDALAGMSKIIEKTIAIEEDDKYSDEEPFVRPQMLFLTGDQIYADDVADSLLFMIIENCRNLFGWNETMPLTDPVMDFSPGLRGNGLNFPDGESEILKSHLFTFQEYIMMYIMVWSNKLWIPNPDDTSSAITPSFEQILFPSLPTQTELKNMNYSELRGGQEMMIDLYTSDKPKKFEAERNYIDTFHSTLEDVQRLFANIPTLMLIDDHDVTDDLFITEEWCNTVFGESFTQRIVQNALSAFSLCQAWGNTPQFFSGELPGNKLLQKIEMIVSDRLSEAPNDASLIPIIEAIGKIVLPKVSPSEHGTELTRYDEGLDYHWQYSGPNFEVIAIDGRTRRAYRHGAEAEMGSLSDNGIKEQITDVAIPRKKVTFLITGAPFFGINLIEQRLESASKVPGKSIYDIDRESWSLDEATKHRFLEALATRCIDHESLSNSDLRKHDIVVLSGDVHYAFTNKGIFLANETVDEQYKVHLNLVQCCSSSLKNQIEDDYTTTVFQHSLILERGEFFHLASEGYGLLTYWRDPEFHILGVYADNFEVETYEIESGVVVNSQGLGDDALTYLKGGKPPLQPHFPLSLMKKEEGRITWALNTYFWAPPEGHSLRIKSDFEMQSIPQASWPIEEIIADVPLNRSFEDYIIYSGKDPDIDAHNHNYLGVEGLEKNRINGRYVVGLNNFGDVRLKPWNGSKKVIHKIWWRNISVAPFNTEMPTFPLTIHKVDIF